MIQDASEVFETIRLNLIVGDGHCQLNIITVYIATRLREERFGIRAPLGTRLFCFSKRLEQLWGPLRLLFDGLLAFSRG
jgi:hypothetical protein